MRAMLDSMVTDHFLASPEVRAQADALVRDRRLTLLTTHVQRDQVGQTPDEAKRAGLLAVQQRLTPIATHGLVWDISNWDEGYWGSPEAGERTVALAGNSPKHMADALIAVTAEANSDVLVTDDARLRKRAERLNFAKPIWSFDQLAQWIASESEIATP
ncbi:hypothetical protein [Sediminicoccus sp. KRV36]|uniref:hypothetical protein n=1 Tax=Sediminicoccus sp. KRV36 TaxID=3133721 RepID=UPI00200DE78E|nr:hypothetical protein [Sediminicoccus rosea]UPY38730.1 hypothetical protein LHU95_08545 [Sediminicoccus rosea]